MSKKISGTINGTGAALTVGIGFQPDYVKLINIEGTSQIWTYWSINSRALEQIEGVEFTPGSAADALAFGEGVVIYRGGDKMAAASTSYVLLDKTPDKRNGNADVMGTIHSWTLGSSANRTGNFNAEANTTYVGEGSRICIRSENTYDPKWATILAMTSNGEAANQVTLNESIGSGNIFALQGMYDYISAVANDVIPAGFKINLTDGVNVSGNLLMFEAGTYD